MIWSDSICFRLPVTWECFVGKICHANIFYLKIFPATGRRIFRFLIELSLNRKSRMVGLSFRGPIADQSSFQWFLVKLFPQNVFDTMLQKKFNSFYDRINCKFQTLKCWPREKDITTTFRKKLLARCSVDANQS